MSYTVNKMCKIQHILCSLEHHVCVELDATQISVHLTYNNVLFSFLQ